MQDINFPPLRMELPCQPDKGQISFIKHIKCGDSTQNGCVLFTLAYTHIKCDTQRVGMMTHRDDG